MKFDVPYERLTKTVLGDCMLRAEAFYDNLVPEQRHALHAHIMNYMAATEEHDLYQPFRGFANELFAIANLPFQFLDRHDQPRPNDDMDRGDPKRK